MPLISRSLALSLGTTSVVSVLLFLYFRNKISSVEHKVSMLFKMIEEHHQQQQIQFRERPQQPQQSQFQVTERINVSDDEDDDEDSDEEYSDEEESADGRLSIGEAGGKIKTIEIEALDQQERTNKNNLDDIPSLGENDEISVQKNTNNDGQDTNNDVVYNNLMKGITKKTEQPNLKSLKIKELKKICANRGLNKYSHLNKAGLVELLQTSE